MCFISKNKQSPRGIKTVEQVTVWQWLILAYLLSLSYAQLQTAPSNLKGLFHAHEMGP